MNGRLIVVLEMLERAVTNADEKPDKPLTWWDIIRFIVHISILVWVITTH